MNAWYDGSDIYKTIAKFILHSIADDQVTAVEFCFIIVLILNLYVFCELESLHADRTMKWAVSWQNQQNDLCA